MPDENNSNPNMYKSWLAWRIFFAANPGANLLTLTGTEHPLKALFIKKFREKLELPAGDICPRCDGWEVTTLNEDKVRCICSILAWQTKIRMSWEDVFPLPERCDLRDLKIWGDPAMKLKLNMFMKEINDFVSMPTHWLTITGPVGTGKTHALKALAHIFFPVAVYVSATDFESRIYTWLNEQSLEGNIEILTRAPILLFDDLGADYGSKFSTAKLREVIDWRYSHSKDHVTVVTTNMPLKMLISNAAAQDRIASRIQDKQIARIVDLSMVYDYRLAQR